MGLRLVVLQLPASITTQTQPEVLCTVPSGLAGVNWQHQGESWTPGRGLHPLCVCVCVWSILVRIILEQQAQFIIG